MLGSPHTKLSDFGIAYDVSRPTAGYDLVYSPHASPQVASGQAPQVADDVFSAGMTLFRLVNNYSNWEAARGEIPDWRRSVRSGSLTADIGFQSFVPKTVQRIIKLACQANPSKRYKSCLDFRQALEKLKFGSAWVRDGQGNWHCENESISIHGAAVEHLVKGRRRRTNCQKFSSIIEASQFAVELVVSRILV
jgi:serine/threonine-protein kinase